MALSLKAERPSLPQGLSVDNLTPAAVINRNGIIEWSNSSVDVPCLPVGRNISDVVPDLPTDDILGANAQVKVHIDGVEYLLTSYPDIDQQTTVVLLENIDVLKARLSFYIDHYEILQGLLDSPYEGYAYVDEHGVIRYVNNTLAKYFNLSVDQIVGLNHKDFPLDENLDQVLKTREIKPLGVVTGVGNKRAIGSIRPVYRNGRFAGALGRYFSIDIKDITKFGGEYLNLVASMELREIIADIDAIMMQLHSYREEFQRRHAARFSVDNIVGKSFMMQDLKRKVLKISKSPSSVLIMGESGTGKELFAQAIHFHSDRSSHPLVMVNCAAIPESLLESELFGYVEGAFTGARKGGKLGKFELANQGTIFLDEIGDMPLSMQAKLLRVLQDRQIERVGGERPVPVDVRVISATNKDLATLVKEGSFRADLYYRLNVVTLHIPPLRERKEDLPDLVDYIISVMNTKLRRNVIGVTEEAMDLLMRHNWPGNVRELINVLEAAMNFCGGALIDVKDLPSFLQSYKDEPADIDKDATYLQARIDNAEKKELVSVLEQCHGNRKAAAEVLGVSKATLWRLMKKHGLL